MIGEQIAHFRVIDQIGEGGMGVIYKAEDLRLHRLVALKILPHHLTRNTDAKERFIQEARSASALDHQNICTIYDFDQIPDGRLFIAMALYDGDTLEHIIRQGTLTLNEVLNIAIQISKGLAKAHSKGIIHRDIKPSNIILTSDQQVKILDFGLAKLAGMSGIPEDKASGTVAYMSPEQLQGRMVDDRSDMWSLGVLLYELLTGVRPFRGKFRQSIIYSILNEEPPELSTFGEQYPPELHTIVNRALAKNPDHRYTYILEMLKDLQQLQEKVGGAVAEIGRREDVLPKSRRLYFAVPVFLTILIVCTWLLIPERSLPVNSITVLPFDDKQTGYLGKGFARDLLSRLAGIQGLKVMIPSQFDSAATPETVSEEIGVRFIIQGSIIQVEQRLKLDARLISMPDRQLIWSEIFESPVTHVPAVQNAIVRRINQILRLKTISEEGWKGSAKVDPHAYDYYIKGREYYYRYRRYDNETAISLFHKALLYDSLYACAYAGLADAFAQKTLRFGLEESWLDSSETSARKALKIDPESSEAYKALAMVAYTRSQFGKARDLNQQALTNNASYVPAIANLGWTYFNLGLLDSAQFWLDRALALNPTNPAITMGKGLTALSLSDYDEARAYLEKTADLDPGYQPSPLAALVILDIIRLGPDQALENIKAYLKANSEGGAVLFTAGDAALQSVDPAEAAGYYQQVLTANPQAWNPFTGVNISTALGYILYKTGYRTEAEEMFGRSINMDRQNIERGNGWWGVAYDMAAVHAVQGEESLALVWLDDAFRKGFVLRPWLARDPLFENLRDNDSFDSMLTENGW